MKEYNSVICYCVIILIIVIFCLPVLSLWCNKKIVNRIMGRADIRIARNRDKIKELNTNIRTPTIYVAIFISVVTLVAMILFYTVHDVVTEKINPISVKWDNVDSVYLKSGPAWFFYNSKDSTLNVQHSVSDAEKIQLVNLLSQDDKNYKNYSRAIDELTYKSNVTKDKRLYNWLLFLYAVCGLIGVQLRTIKNFIGVTCFKNNFEFHIWWPWYLVRPLQGFLTGGIVFLLIDGKQMPFSDPSGGLNTLILALSFLGGFSTEEVYGLLRKLSKKFFGSETPNNTAQCR